MPVAVSRRHQNSKVIHQLEFSCSGINGCSTAFNAYTHLMTFIHDDQLLVDKLHIRIHQLSLLSLKDHCNAGERDFFISMPALV